MKMNSHKAVTLRIPANLIKRITDLNELCNKKGLYVSKSDLYCALLADSVKLVTSTFNGGSDLSAVKDTNKLLKSFYMEYIFLDDEED